MLDPAFTLYSRHRMKAVTVCLLFASFISVGAQAPPKRPTTPPVWHPRLEQFTPPGAIQTEFGSPLSEAGYRKLLAALRWRAPTERTDYYFDIYDGRQFVLRTGDMPLKVRIKIKKQTPEWQVSRFVDKDQVTVGALGVYVHTTESWDAPLEIGRAAALLAASDEFASKLRTGGATLRAAADKVAAAWQTLRSETALPGLMVIDRLLAKPAHRFYPRKLTPAKVRVSTALPGFTTPPVTLMLGTEPEVDADGNRVLTYGLEAEADQPLTRKQAHNIAIAIGHFMQRAGLAAIDQREVPSLSNDYTLRQLAR
jgi:hypothetical protein